MNSLKVCFVGVGSIAKRHIRNLREVCNKRGIELHIDALRRMPDSVEGVDCVFTSVGAMPSDYDCVFITNPTSMHLDYLKLFHDKGKNFFIEKPVVSAKQIKDAKGFVTRNGSTYYVACPLRYTSVIQFIKENVDAKDVLSIRSISSSYLPDWRPGTDYTESYSAHKDQGGGVDIDLIHEWDYLTYLFGWPKNVKCLMGKKSDLKIDSNDFALYVAEYDDKVVELHLDYFGRETIREIEIFTKEDTIIGDLINNTLTFKREKKTINFKEERDSFQQRELECFLDIVEGKIDNCSDYKHGIDLLLLSQGEIEE